MATDKIPSGVRFPEPLLRKITWVAKENHRSFNAQMEMIAEDCVRAYEKEHGEIQIETAEALV